MTPEGWTEAKIEDVLTRVAHAVDVQPDEQYQQIGIRSHAKGLFDKPHVSGIELGNKRVFWVEPDCFVVNIVFAWEQAVGRTTALDVGKIASHRFPMYRPKGNKADVDFFLYLFKSSYGKHLLTLASPGGAGRNKTLGQKEFNNTVVSIPPLAEQQKISEILCTWDQAIEATESLIENAKAQKKALMQQLLSGKRRLQGNSGDWWESPLSEIVDRIYGGGTPPRDVSHYWHGDIPWLTVKDLVKERVTGAKEHITADGLKNSSSNMVPSGTVIIAARMALGKAVIADCDVAINQDLKAMVCGSTIRPAYLQYWLLFRASHIEKLGTGSTVKGLQLEDLNSLRISLPKELSEQDQIVETLTCADREVAIYESQLSSLRDQRAALLTSLISGQRRVKLDGGV